MKIKKSRKLIIMSEPCEIHYYIPYVSYYVPYDTGKGIRISHERSGDYVEYIGVPTRGTSPAVAKDYYRVQV